MSKWKIHTPEGVQDILFEGCYAKRNIEQKIRDLFRARGFFEVETPNLEFYDTFAGDGDMMPQETMFKFFDQQGRILVLRPDLTIPIARVAATKCKGMQYPLKFSYIGNAYKYNELGGGKQKEFTQAGVEILGVNTPEADAEVIATAINAVLKAGIDNFQIDIGQVEFFKGLMEETGLPEEDMEQIRVLIDSKDFLGLEELIKRHDMPGKLKGLILDLPGLFGSTDVIERVEKITTNSRSLEALSILRRVLEILDDYGLSKYVSIDLGMVQSLNYYTGIIFRGVTYGIGFPILSGGRYDNLVGNFGLKCPATGFSLGINMIMTALDRQKIESAKPGVDSLVCYGVEGRKQAFSICEALRSQGLNVEVDISGYGVEAAKAYAKSKGIGGLLYILDDENVQVHNFESGEISEVRISDLVNRP